MPKLKTTSTRFRKPNIENEKHANDGPGQSPTSQNNGLLTAQDEETRRNFSEDTTLRSLATAGVPFTPTTATYSNSVVDIRRATRTRRNTIVFASLCLLISAIFLILTIIGNTHNKPVLRNTWFFQINISNIIPTTAGDAILVNSLARSLGLHDYYQVGLWNFCEGYNDEGITHCSTPSPKYWFNPVSIILDELLPGSTIALPAEVVNILALVKTASNLMTAFFIAGCVLNSVSALTTPIVIASRWWSLPMAIFSFIGALLTTAAAIIATVMWTIFRNTFMKEPGLNIEAFLGTQMFVFMWIGAAFAVLGWGANAGMGCCCASERDVRTGRKRGAGGAYGEGGKGFVGGGSVREGSERVGSGRAWRGQVDGVVRRIPPIFRSKHDGGGN